MEKELPQLSTLSGTKELPMKDADPLSLLQNSLKKVGELAARQGKTTGVAEGFGLMEERYGVTPGDLPGGSVAQMTATVSNAMIDPVASRLESVSDIVSTIKQTKLDVQENAHKQVSLMMDSDQWNTLMSKDIGSATELWKDAGFVGEPYRLPESPLFDDLSTKDLMGFARDAGVTLEQAQDVLYGTQDGSAPDWFIRDKFDPYIREGLSSMYGDKWTNEYQKMFNPEQKASSDLRDWFIRRQQEQHPTMPKMLKDVFEEKTSGVAATEDRPLSDIRSSNTYMDYANASWQSFRADPQGLADRQTAMRQTEDYARSIIDIDLGKEHFERELRQYARLMELKDPNFKVSDSDINSIVDALWGGMPIDMDGIKRFLSAEIMITGDEEGITQQTIDKLERNIAKNEDLEKPEPTLFIDANGDIYGLSPKDSEELLKELQGGVLNSDKIPKILRGETDWQKIAEDKIKESAWHSYDD